MSKLPRLRWLLLLQLVTVIAGMVDTGSIAAALQSAGVVAPGIASLVLFSLRVAQAMDAREDDEENPMYYTMDGGRNVKRPGLWELVW